MTPILDRISNFCSDARSWFAGVKQALPTAVTYLALGALGSTSLYFGYKTLTYKKQLQEREKIIRDNPTLWVEEVQKDPQVIAAKERNNRSSYIDAVIAALETKDVQPDDRHSIAYLYQDCYLQSIANALILALIAVGIYVA